MHNDWLELGTWNVMCQRCGFKRKAYDIAKDRSGILVCRDTCLDPREQIPSRARSLVPLPWIRPEVSARNIPIIVRLSGNQGYMALGNYGAGGSNRPLISAAINGNAATTALESLVPPVCRFMAEGTMPATTFWVSLGHNGSQWVAGGLGPNMAYSADGISWNAGTGAFALYQWQRLVWFSSESKWWAYTGGPNTAAMWSSDGIAWTQSGHNGPTPNTFSGPTWIGTRIYEFSGGASDNLYSSLDGSSWGTHAGVMPSATYAWTCLATNGTTTVALQGLTGSSNVAASIANSSLPTGTWTARTLPSTDSWLFVIWTGRVFFAVSVASGQGARSYDGETWESVTIPTTINDPTPKTVGHWGKPCATSDYKIYLPIDYVAGPDKASKYLSSRDDGTTWEECSTGTFERRIPSATDGSRIVLVGYWGPAGVGSNLSNYSL